MFWIFDVRSLPYNPMSHTVCIFSNYSDNYLFIEHVLPVQRRGKVFIIPQPQTRKLWGSFQMSRCTLHPVHSQQETNKGGAGRKRVMCACQRNS